MTNDLCSMMLDESAQIRDNDILITKDAHRHIIVVVWWAGGKTRWGDVPVEGHGVTQPEDAEVIVWGRTLAVLRVDSGAAHLNQE